MTRTSLYIELKYSAMVNQRFNEKLLSIHYHVSHFNMKPPACAF